MSVRIFRNYFGIIIHKQSKWSIIGHLLEVLEAVSQLYQVSKINDLHRVPRDNKAHPTYLPAVCVCCGVLVHAYCMRAFVYVRICMCVCRCVCVRACMCMYTYRHNTEWNQSNTYGMKFHKPTHDITACPGQLELWRNDRKMRLESNHDCWWNTTSSNCDCFPAQMVQFVKIWKQNSN